MIIQYLHYLEQIKNSFMDINVQGLIDKQLVKNFSYINGSWHSSASDIAVTNPATGEVVANVSNAGIVETELAIQAANDAFKIWAGKSANERAALMRGWFDLMMAHQEDLGRILTSEQGKPLAEAKGEIAGAADIGPALDFAVLNLAASAKENMKVVA